MGWLKISAIFARRTSLVKGLVRNGLKSAVRRRVSFGSDDPLTTRIRVEGLSEWTTLASAFRGHALARLLIKSDSAARGLKSSRGTGSLIAANARSRVVCYPCRPLKVSSAMPDLSRAPRPSVTMRSYCSFVALAKGRVNPQSCASWYAMPESFAAWAAEK